MARLLSVFVPQIRNSIDHSDWHYDYQTEVIVFADRDKPDLLIPPEQLRIMCDMMIVSELCISTAIDVFHAQLWKVIAKDARKLTQYCDSLKIDQDTLLKKYVSKGVSLFQLRWMLEQVLLGQNKKPR